MPLLLLLPHLHPAPSSPPSPPTHSLHPAFPSPTRRLPPPPRQLEGGSYGADSNFSAAAFAADVRLVTANAVAYSPEAENECHKAAKAGLVAFERAFLKAGLATDGGEALKAAEASAKPPPAATRKRARGEA